MGGYASKEPEPPPPEPEKEKEKAGFALVKAFVIGSAATLSILFYISVAVVKTMLTKARRAHPAPDHFARLPSRRATFSREPTHPSGAPRDIGHARRLLLRLRRCHVRRAPAVFLIDRSAWAVPKKEYLPGFLLVCVLVAFDLGFTNIAIAMLSLTLQQCLIATNPAFTVTIESFYKRALAHPAIYAIIAVLCCGPIVMATAGAPEKINGVGVIMQILGVICSACKGVFLHALLSTVKKDLGGVGVLFWIDAIILLVLVPWALANGELVDLLHEPKNVGDWFNLLFTAVLGGVRFYSQVLVLKFHPASSLAVANLGMQALNMYLAIWLFGTPALTPHVVGGSVLALAMAALYSYFKWSRVLERGACFAVHEDFRKCCALPCLRRTEDFRGRLPPGIVE